jgi:RHS repeat-associated protein
VTKTDSGGTKTYRRDGVDVTDPVLSDGSLTYTPGISTRSGSTSKFQHSDWIGSEIRQTDSSGTVTSNKRWDAFGNQQSSSGTQSGPFGFAGDWGYQVDGDASLQLLGHRYYDPSVGRFLTRDPAQDGENWYGYCRSRPTVDQDPSGELVPLILLAVALIVVAVSTDTAYAPTSPNITADAGGRDAREGLALSGASILGGRPDMAIWLLIDTAGGTHQGGFDSIGGVKRAPTYKVRANWEETYGYQWPTDPITGKPLIAHHHQAIADGGGNEGSNIVPVTQDQHAEIHALDWVYWGRRGGGGGLGE